MSAQYTTFLSPSQNPTRSGLETTPPSRIRDQTDTVGAGGSFGAQNLWTCVSCRRRKVKCDKKNPCTNCAKAKIECIIPNSGRSSRKPRKTPDVEFLQRLVRLESVVNALKPPVASEGDGASVSPFPRESDEVELFRQWRKVSAVKIPTSEMNSASAGFTPHSSTIPVAQRSERLLRDKRGSRYVNNCFWASLAQEVDDLKCLLSEPEDDSEDERFVSYKGSAGQAFIFGFSSSAVDMLPLHPPRELIPRIWSLFKTNVDPLVKLFHIPTMEPEILEIKDCLNNLQKGKEALMFALYYSVVSSLTSNECAEEFGESKAVLSARYRFAFEQALARANFLESGELVTLQAFVIFLVALRRNDNARIIWALTGLVVRVAQMIGLHRDGIHFGLAPFEVEMRRRLWWQVCVLDARTSEDHGCDATILEAQFDTQMPLNVNDTDLHPGMTELPESRMGLTEMTVCLVGFELANLFRRILYVPPGAAWPGPSFAALTDDQKEKWITECHQRMDDTYLTGADVSVPSFWVASTLTRLLLAKMWLMAFHPSQRPDGGVNFPHRIKEKLFVTSVESIEYANLLDNDPRAQKLAWLFRTYFQWHSTVFALSELCNDTQGELVERAWRAIEVLVRTRIGDLQTDPRQALLWRPLKRLLLKARIAREKELLAETRGNLDPITCYPAIDMLLSLRVASGAALEQLASSTTDTPAIPDEPRGLYFENGFPSISRADQLNPPASDINTDSLDTEPLGLQPHVHIDHLGSHQAAIQSAALTIPAVVDPQHELEDLSETSNWVTWNDIVMAYEAENNAGPVPEPWAWY